MKSYIGRHYRSLLLAAAVALPGSALAASEILNASYDISRELFEQINPVFQQHWKATHNEVIKVNQSHAGSSRQAQAIIQGLRADVVTFNQVTDIQILHDRGNFVPKDWQKKLPNNSSPYYSTTAFLVREGNPKNIRDWDDLVREDVRLVFPNPKTSGNGRYTYLAAWLHAHNAFAGDEAKIREFITRFLANVAVFDTGGRGATTSFVERQLGDVLLTFESEVNLIRKEYESGNFQVVVPKSSILAEFPVAVVERVARQRKTLKQATGYVEFLYQEPAQRILAQNFYRVHHPKVKEEFAAQFPSLTLNTVESVFGSWDNANSVHFGTDGVLDQLLVRARR
jgi:sulfate/thiosulfate transport system substrate-binding protein